MQTNFTITGMHCVSCKRLIEEVCKDVSGVEDCVVDMETGSVVLTHNDSCDLSLVIKEVNDLGDYTMKIVS